MSSQAGPSPFAAYASNFLSRSFLPGATVAASTMSSQPLFYSVTDGEEDGERHLRASELDDEGDPHLRGGSRISDEEIEDPYLDEDELDGLGPNEQSIPLIQSGMSARTQKESEHRQEGQRQGIIGWRTHRPVSPSNASDSGSSSSASSSNPPSDFYGRHPPTPPPTRTTLTESLLPRDGQQRSLFNLPDPSRVPLRKYHDSPWTILWCSGITACAIGSLLVLFTTSKPSKIPSPLPYSTLTHVIPLLMFLVLISTAVSYAYLLVLRAAVRPALILTAVAVPVAMIIASLWAFAGSFFWTGKEAGWAETTGLRIFSLLPLFIAYLTAKGLYARRARLQSTISVVELATTQLLSQLPLLALSPALLFASLLASLPFLSLFLHLLLIGYFGKDSTDTWEWHVRPYARWLAFGTVVMWVWSWGVSRGVLRVTVAGAIGSWYFNPTSQTDTFSVSKFALNRATGPNLGTVCISSLLLTAVNALTFAAHSLRRMTTPPWVPAFLHPLTLPASILSNAFANLSGYALVYTGLTGEPFWTSARRSSALTSVKGRAKRGDYSLLSTLLMLSAFSAGFLSAIAGYLFTAYTLQRPAHAPLAALLTGILSFLVCWFCLSLVDDVADSLYMCYCMDVDTGVTSRQEVFVAFEGQPHPVV